MTIYYHYTLTIHIISSQEMTPEFNMAVQSKMATEIQDGDNPRWRPSIQDGDVGQYSADSKYTNIAPDI